MYEKRADTARVHRGVRQGAAAAPAGCVPVPFLRGDCRRDTCLEKKEARASRGASASGVKTFPGNDATIVAQKPLAVRVAAYALLGLTLTGVLPAFAVVFICDALKALNAQWLVLPMVVAAFLLLVRTAGGRR